LLSPLLIVCFESAPAAAAEERQAQRSQSLMAPLRQQKRKGKRSAGNPRKQLKIRKRFSSSFFGVSVRDLFKDKDVKTTDNEMKGCIFYNGEIHTFNTRGEIEIFLKGN
jgi:hypothetical protein